MAEERTTGEMNRGSGVASSGATQAQPRAELREAETSPETLYTQATEAAQSVADQAEDMARRAYEMGERYVQEGRERYPQADRYYRDGTRMVEQQVQESPWLALLLAGTVGYVLALLVHGRD